MLLKTLDTQEPVYLFRSKHHNVTWYTTVQKPKL